MTPPVRVVVVDDEENIAFLVASALRLAGMEPAIAASGSEAVRMAREIRPDAMVLDIMLPDYDGFEVLRRLRDRGHTFPVVFLTARGDSRDRVRGLRDGGDDYVVKPFDVAELVARVELRLKRTENPTDDVRLRVADLELDMDQHTVYRAGHQLHLSPTEFKLLYVLLVNAGRVLPRQQLLDQVWSYGFDGEPAIVDTYISYLRKKIDAYEPALIHTVRGVGFTLKVLE
ncbi:MAG: response regulator transcription factor [Thermomicrobiales bacterium]|nr:response regulator transcription factor [Thermomicrobiales bacterium]